MTAINTVKEETVLSGKWYTPFAGIQYEMKEKVFISMKRITPAVVLEYNKLKKKPAEQEKDAELEDEVGKVDVDPEAALMTLINRCKVVTEFDEAYNDPQLWKDFSMPVLWRVIEDFLSLSNPNPKKPN